MQYQPKLYLCWLVNFNLSEHSCFLYFGTSSFNGIHFSKAQSEKQFRKQNVLNFCQSALFYSLQLPRIFLSLSSILEYPSKFRLPMNSKEYPKGSSFWKLSRLSQMCSALIYNFKCSARFCNFEEAMFSLIYNS